MSQRRIRSWWFGGYDATMHRSYFLVLSLAKPDDTVANVARKNGLWIINRTSEAGKLCCCWKLHRDNLHAYVRNRSRSSPTLDWWGLESMFLLAVMMGLLDWAWCLGDSCLMALSWISTLLGHTRTIIFTMAQEINGRRLPVLVLDPTCLNRGDICTAAKLRRIKIAYLMLSIIEACDVWLSAKSTIIPIDS